MNKSAALFILLVFSMTLATPALCQKERAKELFDKGVTALERKNFKNALSAFEEAYEISPHWAVLAHIGTCYANLNKPLKAIAALNQYLEDGGNKIPDNERETAMEIIQYQRRKIGVLLLSVEKRGVEALVDGESIGMSPFDEKPLLPGSHEVAVVFGKGDVVRRNFNIEAGQEYLLRIEQEQHMATAPVPPTVRTVEEMPKSEQEAREQAMSDPGFSAPPEESEGSKVVGSLIPFWIALGLTGASVATAAVGWGLFAHYKLSEGNYDDYLKTIQKVNTRFKDFTWEETCKKEKEDDLTDASAHYCNAELNRRDYAKRADQWFIVGIAGSAAAVVSGALSIIFYVNRDWFGDSDEIAFNVAPVLNRSTSGLSLTLQF